MDSTSEQLILSRLDDLKNDVNRASDRHDAGMRKLFELHEEHGREDNRRFEAIDAQFKQAAVLAAEAKGVAKTTAKFWGLCAGLPVPIITGIWGIWKYIHGLTQ
jgi:hypothetical protein